MGNALPPGVREKAALNRERALELRLAGATYRQIGKAIGVGPSRAFRYVQHVLAEVAARSEEKADELKRLEDQRLDALLLSWWGRATAGDKDAAAIALRVLERRAKLHGLDAPAKSDVTTDGKPVRFVVRVNDGRIESEAVGADGVDA